MMTAGHAVLCGLLMVFTWTDIRTRQIFWPAAVVTAAAGLLLHWLLPSCTAAESIAGMGIGALLLLIALACHRALGTGDGVTVLACGAWLGPMETFHLLLTALCLAAVWAVLLMLRKKQTDAGFPFMPFLLAAEIWLWAAG